MKDRKYFHGGDYIQMDYAKAYPTESTPSVWYIEEAIRNAGLQTRQPKRKQRGGAEYLLYPVRSIRNLGYTHQSADFIGKKYITGRSEPVSIFSTSYYAPFKLYQIQRIPAEKSVYAIECLKEQWHHYPIPDIFRLDNGLQFRGTARGKRSIGTFLIFLLNCAVTPLFGSPSKPWTNPYVEGHNRVFNEKVWGTNRFTSLPHIDRECRRFNQESVEFFKFRYSPLIVNGSFRYLESGVGNTTGLSSLTGKKIYFIRFAESFDRGKTAQITIMNDTVRIPEKYSHQFVFVEWDLQQECLSVFSEYQGVATLIEKIKFPPNW